MSKDLTELTTEELISRGAKLAKRIGRVTAELETRMQPSDRVNVALKRAYRAAAKRRTKYLKSIAAPLRKTWSEQQPAASSSASSSGSPSPDGRTYVDDRWADWADGVFAKAQQQHAARSSGSSSGSAWVDLAASESGQYVANQPRDHSHHEIDHGMTLDDISPIGSPRPVAGRGAGGEGPTETAEQPAKPTTVPMRALLPGGWGPDVKPVAEARDYGVLMTFEKMSVVTTKKRYCVLTGTSILSLAFAVDAMRLPGNIGPPVIEAIAHLKPTLIDDWKRSAMFAGYTPFDEADQ